MYYTHAILIYWQYSLLMYKLLWLDVLDWMHTYYIITYISIFVYNYSFSYQYKLAFLPPMKTVQEDTVWKSFHLQTWCWPGDCPQTGTVSAPLPASMALGYHAPCNSSHWSRTSHRDNLHEDKTTNRHRLDSGRILQSPDLWYACYLLQPAR